MNYKEATEYLYSLKFFGSQLGHESILILLEGMGNPHKKYKTILVGGTNGKGSNVAMISSILKEAGFKVGIFTKPHLSTLFERIVFDDERISENDMIRLVEYTISVIEKLKAIHDFRHPTFFEFITAIAFKYFEEKGVDFAVLEVGMGGRLDATNVVDSMVSVITNVSLEHTEVLGDTVLKIAREKAGIIKENGILITATEDDKVFALLKKISDDKKSRIFRVGKDIKFEKVNSNIEGHFFNLKFFDTEYDDLFIPLLGDYQLLNAASTLGVIEGLKLYNFDINEKAIREGFRKVRWPGRVEIIQKNPFVILDCAKDIAAMEKLKETILKYFDYERLILVISFSSDKKIKGMVNTIVPISDFVIITKHKVIERAARTEFLSELVKKHNKNYMRIEDVKNAVRKALSISNENDLIVVTGSLFSVGEAREIWYNKADFKWGRELNFGPSIK